MKTNRQLFLIIGLMLGMLNGFSQNNVIFTASTSSSPVKENVLVGVGAGAAITSGNSRNTFVGYGAGSSSSSGQLNAIFGMLQETPIPPTRRLF